MHFLITDKLQYHGSLGNIESSDKSLCELAQENSVEALSKELGIWEGKLSSIIESDANLQQSSKIGAKN